MKFLHVFVILAVVACAAALSPDCPSYSQVTTCTPKCKEDSECAALGGKCCPNLCNHKSCVTKGNTNKSGDSKCEICFWFKDLRLNVLLQTAQIVDPEATAVTWSATISRNATWTRQLSDQNAFVRRNGQHSTTKLTFNCNEGSTYSKLRAGRVDR